MNESEGRRAGRLLAGSLSGMRMVPHEAVPRGEFWVNERDHEDAMTERPTRTDYELGRLLRIWDEVKREAGFDDNGPRRIDEALAVLSEEPRT